MGVRGQTILKLIFLSYRRSCNAHGRWGVHSQRLVMYSPPDEPITVLVNETGGVKALDFSSDGHLLVSGEYGVG